MSRDTSSEVEAKLDELLARRSGSERVQMMSDMFDAARVLALANITAHRPDIAAAELKIELFERLYGDDFSDEERHRIRLRLATQSSLATE